MLGVILLSDFVLFFFSFFLWCWLKSGLFVLQVSMEPAAEVKNGVTVLQLLAVLAASSLCLRVV